MTWVIGASAIFGYGIIVSDICVQFSNGTTQDILQKVYPVGNYLAAGFAGSIKIGFSLIEDLQNFLFLPKGFENKAWHPEWVATHWSSNAQKIFDKAEPDEKKLQSQILMVGASPDKTLTGISSSKIYICVLKSPNFYPEIHDKPMSFYSIGSGSEIELYKKALLAYSDFRQGVLSLQFENGLRGGWGQGIILRLTDIIKHTATVGISKHLHLCIVSLGQIHITNNDHIENITYKDNSDNLKFITILGGLDSQIIVNKTEQPTSEKTRKESICFKMPSVARNYKELETMYNNLINLKGAHC